MCQIKSSPTHVEIIYNETSRDKRSTNTIDTEIVVPKSMVHLLDKDGYWVVWVHYATAPALSFAIKSTYYKQLRSILLELP
jgi:hypothetical protein